MPLGQIRKWPILCLERRFWPIIGLLFETEVIDTAGSKSAQIAASFDASVDESDASKQFPIQTLFW
ncbi:hypothetical protein HG15A2_49420 [Adhaeretor mobilis]|uniref:Uncharacterized protein n=1 Tax=Adhaeretor mobilis TaxID=1930276 RepID=A0A517N382_9BACT|nr:hypothetical protein HG15A2_49420 [Adhaeretor mobilis]